MDKLTVIDQVQPKKPTGILGLARNLIIIIVITIVAFKIAAKYNMVIPLLTVMFLFFGGRMVYKKDWLGLKFYLFTWVSFIVLNYWLKLPWIITPLLVLSVFLWYKGILKHIMLHPLAAIESFCLQVEKKIYEETMAVTTIMMKRQGSTDEEIDKHFTNNKYKLRVYKNTVRIDDLKQKGADFNVFGNE